MYTVKITETYDGGNASVYLDGVLIMGCTWLGESDDKLIEMAKAFVASRSKQP